MASVLPHPDHQPSPFVQGDRVRLSDEGRRVRRRFDHERIGTIIKTIRAERYVYVVWDAVNGPADLVGVAAARELVLVDHLQPTTSAPAASAGRLTIRPPVRRRS